MDMEGRPGHGNVDQSARMKTSCVTRTCPLPAQFALAVWAIAFAALSFSQWRVAEGLIYRPAREPAEESVPR